MLETKGYGGLPFIFGAKHYSTEGEGYAVYGVLNTMEFGDPYRGLIIPALEAEQPKTYSCEFVCARNVSVARKHVHLISADCVRACGGLTSLNNDQTVRISDPGRRRKIAKTMLVAALIFLASSLPTLSHPARAISAPSFTFSAAGDYGGITTGSNGQNVANKIAQQNPRPAFHIALGDLGYDTQNPANWCSNFKGIYPGTGSGALVLVTGNHDTYSVGPFTYGDGSTGTPSDVITHEDGHGFLDTIGSSGPGYASACGLPPGINWIGSGTSSGGYTCTTDNSLTPPTCYGREYYFDYPTSNPIMRFIFISAGIGGPWPNYSVGSPSYNWLKARIDEAHSAGLWVAVALHKECLSDGTVHTSCETTFDPFNLAITHGVDLWLDGHEHNYERSYQLSSCTGSGNTVSSCQKNTGTFVRGSGMVVNIIGTGGNGNYPICSTNCSPKQDYFQRLCGSNNDIGILQTSGCSNDYGFVKFTVDTNRILAQWVDACVSTPCGFTDSYSINVPGPPGDFSISANPVSLTIPQAVSVTTSITVLSFGGFGGLVTLAAAQSPPNNKFSVCWDGVTCMPARSTNITVIAGESSSVNLTVNTGCGTAPGPYAVRVNATSTTPSIFHWIVLPVTVTASACGGSVGAGTLITLADRTQTPVQNLRVGLQLLSYDMTRHEYAITTITRFETVVTYNQMVISTSTGKPLIVDQNPAQKLYAQLPDGTVSLVSVTDLQVGYKLFQPLSLTWISITNIQYQNSGIHTMYDVYTTAPGNYIANGYLDPLKDGPH